MAYRKFTGRKRFTRSRFTSKRSSVPRFRKRRRRY